VTIMGSRVRDVPCMDQSVVLMTLEGNSGVNIIGETDGWYKVKIGDKIGWIGARLIKLADKAVAEKVVKIEPETKTVTKPGNWKDWVVGVSNTNWNKIKAGNTWLWKSLKGKIVLLVEKKGEAFYLNPKTGALVPLKNREQVDGMLDKIWSVQKEPVSSQTGTLVLNATASGEGQVKLNWSLKNMESPNGFKVVVSEEPNPVYPGNDYHYLSDPAVRNDVWTNLKAGHKYYFRVCEYLGGSCGKYSNNAVVTVTGTPISQQQGSISLTATVADGKVKLHWGLTDITSSMGFKVVTADHANPVYPGDDYHYLSDPNVRDDSWNLEAGKTYNFRVCEYLGGKCGVYSNNIVVTLP
jgi:hypothetical protein